MGHASLHQNRIVVVGLVGANLRAEKPGLHIVRQQLFHGLTVFSYIPRKNAGSITAIMPRVAAVLPPESRRTKNSGTPMRAAVPKQSSCRFVRLNATFDFTLVRSRGTEIYAANKAPPLMRSENGFCHGTGLEQAETEQNSVAHNAQMELMASPEIATLWISTA